MTAADRGAVTDPPRTSPPAPTETGAIRVLLRLQRDAGNEAVAQLLGTGNGSGPAPFVLARDPVDGATPPGPPAPAGTSPAGTANPYQDLLQPSLDDAQQQTLQQASGGAGLVDLIARRDQLRTLLIRSSYNAPSGGVPEPSVDPVDGGAGAGSMAVDNPEQAAADHAEEQRLTAQINVKLAELGVADEADLIDLVNNRFPTMFLGEAKKVALGMLDDNQQKVQGELDRYSQQVCSPDIEGLLAADAQLGQLDPHELEISISAAEHALAIYQPSAGVLTPDQLAERIPENERSVMVDIANLERNRAALEPQRALYQTTRFSYGRRYPILLDQGYVPGSFSLAPPEELGQLAAKQLDGIFDNIQRVRDAVESDDMKVWEMAHVLDITRARLGVTDPVLLGAIEGKVRAIQSDEAFLGWVKAALAITTSLVAGVLFTPAAGAAVAAAWGTASLVKSISTYRTEEAAEHVAMDPAVADISLNEPTLAWVILDAIGLALDLGAVAKALRPAARALTEAPSAMTLRIFGSEADTALGENAGEQMAAQAATRFGIELGTTEAAGELLARARTLLSRFSLDDDAIARILAKGTDIAHVKGQLFEELTQMDVARRLATGADELLGISDASDIEQIAGHRISDLSGRQLTDGILARRLPDGSLEIVTVIESKAGKAAAQGLRATASDIGDPEEFTRFLVEQDKAGVLRSLNEAGLTDDAAIVTGGGETLSDKAIETIANDKRLRKAVAQAEIGGQVRRDIERLAPDTGPDMSVSGQLDEAPTTILVDGVETRVSFSPTRTRVVGAVPTDVKTGSITKALQNEGFNYQSLQTGAGAGDIDNLARQLAALQTTTEAPATGAVTPGP